MVDIDKTINERESKYGDIKDNGRIWAALYYIVSESPSWERMSPFQQYCINGILVKLSRILSGNPNYKDNWYDIKGYATLGENNDR